MTRLSKISYPYLLFILLLLLGSVSMFVYIVFFTSWEIAIISDILTLSSCGVVFGIFFYFLLKIKLVFKKESEFIIKNVFGFGVRINKDNIESISGELRQNARNISFAIINIILKGNKRIEIDGRFLQNMHEIRREFKNVLGH